MSKILKWKCSECGKEIESLYPKQLESHIKEHKRKHDHQKDMVRKKPLKPKELMEEYK